MAGVLLFAAGVIFFAIMFKLLGITVRSCVRFVSFLINGDDWPVALTILAVCTLLLIAFW